MEEVPQPKKEKKDQQKSNNVPPTKADSKSVKVKAGAQTIKVDIKMKKQEKGHEANQKNNFSSPPMKSGKAEKIGGKDKQAQQETDKKKSQAKNEKKDEK